MLSKDPSWGIEIITFSQPGTESPNTATHPKNYTIPQEDAASPRLNPTEILFGFIFALGMLRQLRCKLEAASGEPCWEPGSIVSQTKRRWSQLEKNSPKPEIIRYFSRNYGYSYFGHKSSGSHVLFRFTIFGGPFVVLISELFRILAISHLTTQKCFC